MLDALSRKRVVNFRPRGRAVGLPSAHASLMPCDSTPGLFKCFFCCRAEPDCNNSLAGPGYDVGTCRACPETPQIDTEIKIKLFARFARVCRNQPPKTSMQGTSKHLLH